MIKNKKTKAKASAQAVATRKIAPAAAPKKAAARSTVKARTAGVAKPVESAKAVAAPAPVQQPVIRLVLSNASAHSVAIAGSFNSWQPEQVTATSNGRWVKELNIAPGRYEYMFVVDGQWVADPNAKEYSPNPFGGLNSVLVIES